MTWMSRMNRQVEVDREKIVWEFLVKLRMEYAAEVCWTEGSSASWKQDLAQMRMSRRLSGLVEMVVQGDLG